MRRCRHCSTVYLEVDNVGRWGCRVHPRPLNQRTNVYPCCGLSVTEPGVCFLEGDGCTRGDHDLVVDGEPPYAFVRAYLPMAAGIVREAVERRIESDVEFIDVLAHGPFKLEQDVIGKAVEQTWLDSIRDPLYINTLHRQPQDKLLTTVGRALVEGGKTWQGERSDDAIDAFLRAIAAAGVKASAIQNALRDLRDSADMSERRRAHFVKLIDSAVVALVNNLPFPAVLLVRRIDKAPDPQFSLALPVARRFAEPNGRMSPAAAMHM